MVLSLVKESPVSVEVWVGCTKNVTGTGEVLKSNFMPSPQHPLTLPSFRTWRCSFLQCKVTCTIHAFPIHHGHFRANFDPFNSADNLQPNNIHHHLASSRLP